MAQKRNDHVTVLNLFTVAFVAGDGKVGNILTEISEIKLIRLFSSSSESVYLEKVAKRYRITVCLPW